MKTKLSVLILALLGGLFTSACSRSGDADCCEVDTPAAKNASAERHPLAGVVVEVFAERGEVRVKHDNIPDFMVAMTMNFKISPAVLAQLKANDRIAAEVFSRDGLWLDHVRRIEANGGEVPLLSSAIAVTERAESEAKPPVVAEKPAAKAAGQLITAEEAGVSAEWLAKAVADYPLDFCMVSDDNLEKNDMGPPQNHIYRQDGQPDQLVRLCCNHCVRDFKKSPAKHMKIISDAAKAKTTPTK